MAATASPRHLGRYEVIKHLATGGMAEVLLARVQAPFGIHHVVIKRVRKDQAQDERFVRMFLDEAQLASMLQHPNIVRVHEIGADRGEYFFAMEYVHGEDLRKVLMEVHKRRDKLPIALITGIVASAAAGLHHAHTLTGVNKEPLNIVHRDVSPANILVGYDGSVRVADFGIAKAALRTVETRSGTLKGKVSYMSPEQVTGKPIDRRSDVYALGIVLYEVATARRLFKGDNDFLTMSAIVQGDIPLPSTHRPDLPRILEDIIMKALSPAPIDRYQSADELKQALEKFTTSLGMKMSPGSIADYMKKLFGSRAEPWLVDDEPTLTTTVDFDGSGTGLVAPPEASVRGALPQMLKPAPSSPIVFARTDLTGRPPTQADLDLSDQSSNVNLAWPSEPTPIRARRKRTVAMAASGAALAGLLTFFVISQLAKDSAPPETVRMTASTPEPPPSPSPEPPPPPTPIAPTIAPPSEPTETAEQAKQRQVEAARVAKLEAEAAKKQQAELDRKAAIATAAEKKQQAEADRLAKLEADKQKRLEAEQLRRGELEKKKLAEAEKKKQLETERQAKAEARAEAAKRRPRRRPPTQPADDKKNWDPNALFPK